MVKLICDFSFVSHYIENFYSDDQKDSAQIVNKSIDSALQGKKVLIIPQEVLEKINSVYSDRELIISSLVDLGEIDSTKGTTPTDTIIKILALRLLDDAETYIISDDSVIKQTSSLKDRIINIKSANEKYSNFD